MHALRAGGHWRAQQVPDQWPCGTGEVSAAPGQREACPACLCKLHMACPRCPVGTLLGTSSSNRAAHAGFAAQLVAYCSVRQAVQRHHGPPTPLLAACIICISLLPLKCPPSRPLAAGGALLPSAPCSRVMDLFQSVQLNINNPTFLIMQGRITKVPPRERGGGGGGRAC